MNEPNSRNVSKDFVYCMNSKKFIFDVFYQRIVNCNDSDSDYSRVELLFRPRGSLTTGSVEEFYNTLNLNNKCLTDFTINQLKYLMLHSEALCEKFDEISINIELVSVEGCFDYLIELDKVLSKQGSKLTVEITERNNEQLSNFSGILKKLNGIKISLDDLMLKCQNIDLLLSNFPMVRQIKIDTRDYTFLDMVEIVNSCVMNNIEVVIERIQSSNMKYHGLNGVLFQSFNFHHPKLLKLTG